MPQIWTFELSLPQKPYSLGSGRWQTCLCCVGEFSKNLRQFHFWFFFCQRKVITKFPNNYHIITSSRHLISPEEWSFPFRNGWTSNLAASDLSQYHYWGRGLDDNGRIFSYILLWNKWENKVDDYVTNHKWNLNYLIFKGRLGLESKSLPDFCSYNYRHVVWGVAKPPCVLQHFSWRDSKEGMPRSLFPRKLSHSHSNSATMRQELHVDSMDFLSFLGNCAIKPANFIYRCLDVLGVSDL